MAIDRRPRAPLRGIHFGGRLDAPPASRTIALLLLPIILVALVAVARANLVSARPTFLGLTAGAEDATPDQLTANAADAIEAATTGGGSGVEFEIVQRAAIHFADGSEPHPLATYLERGHVTPAGYFAEIRRGPDDPDAKPDFEAGTIELRALVRDGVTWRDDGLGWYETDQPPGLGLDPATAALLPTLLRASTDKTDAGSSDGPAKPPTPTATPEATPADDTEPGAAPPDEAPPDAAPPDGAVDPATVGQVEPAALEPSADVIRSVEATAKVADVPGIIAVDLAESTELVEPVVFDFDADGRLIGLTVVARNTRLETDELRVTTTIVFRYPSSAPGLPDPKDELAPDDLTPGDSES